MLDDLAGEHDVGLRVDREQGALDVRGIVPEREAAAVLEPHLVVARGHRQLVGPGGDLLGAHRGRERDVRLGEQPRRHRPGMAPHLDDPAPSVGAHERERALDPLVVKAVVGLVGEDLSVELQSHSKPRPRPCGASRRR